jgi:hypothetical protein
VEFIFARNQELDFPDEINADLKIKSEMKHPPKWIGLKVEKIRCASNEEKDKYFIGNKVWDQWQATKKYIQNQLNGNWQDPHTLPSGYNLSSLLVFVRESCGDYEASQSAKDNVRAHRNRIEKKGETFIDANNNLFKKLYNKHLTKVRSGVWFPDCWLTFLAWGAPSKNPAATLWTPRVTKGSGK